MPGGYKNINGNDGVRFGEGQKQGNGRKKKIYTILKEKGFSADDIKTAFGEMAFYTLSELKSVYDDETKPVIARIVANQFFQALKKSDWAKIKEILEHVIGKPTQISQVDQTITKEVDLSNLSYEQLIKLKESDNKDSD